MNTGPTIASGSAGPEVRRLQRLLVMMRVLGFERIDGVFGPDTDQAVRDVQQGAGLVVDGVAGPLTWGALPADPDTPLLAHGVSSALVAAVQEALTDYGGPGTDTDPGPADGVFGAATVQSVKAYQAERGIAADGIVGDLTWWVPAGAAGATLASRAGVTTV